MLTQGFFPKFFWASQGFLENIICHVMNATLGQIKLRNSFSWAKFSKCNLMHFKLGEDFMMQKAGVTFSELQPCCVVQLDSGG
jgi:hypothetical protein